MGLYSIEVVLVIGGLIYGGILMFVPAHWIVVGRIIALGFGVHPGA